MKKLKFILTILITSSFLLGCPPDDELNTSTREFGIFTVLEDDTTIEMNGEISSASLKNFNKLVAAFPNVNKINILVCNGSSDDATNLELSKKVHEMGMDIHLGFQDLGLIASGGVDFFLAGINRTRESGTKIGVHAWSGANATATDFPVGHEYHLPYINYYVYVGFTQQQAEDFYYFTINAAPADDVHWMTEEEIAKYNLITD
jgi:hypothetical protein